jgi:type IV pilus biogenesis protein CpaD/CtpE
MSKKAVTFRLHESTREELRELSKQYKLSQADILAVSIMGMNKNATHRELDYLIEIVQRFSKHYCGK